MAFRAVPLCLHRWERPGKAFDQGGSPAVTLRRFPLSSPMGRPERASLRQSRRLPPYCYRSHVGNARTAKQGAISPECYRFPVGNARCGIPAVPLCLPRWERPGKVFAKAFPRAVTLRRSPFHHRPECHSGIVLPISPTSAGIIGRSPICPQRLTQMFDRIHENDVEL